MKIPHIKIPKVCPRCGREANFFTFRASVFDITKIELDFEDKSLTLECPLCGYIFARIEICDEQS